MKCQTCREKDVELLTTWERIRNWLFYRVNYVFFPDDLEDLKTQKYTQGYSDGNADGYTFAAKERGYTKVSELYSSIEEAQTIPSYMSGHSTNIYDEESNS